MNNSSIENKNIDAKTESKKDEHIQQQFMMPIDGCTCLFCENQRKKLETKEPKKLKVINYSCDCGICMERLRKEAAAKELASLNGTGEVSSIPKTFDPIKPPTMPGLNYLMNAMNEYYPHPLLGEMKNESAAGRLLAHNRSMDRYRTGGALRLAEPVKASSLKIEIVDGLEIRVIGKCGKAYQMSIEDFESMTARIKSKIELDRQRKVVDFAKSEFEKLQKTDDELEPSKGQFYGTGQVRSFVVVDDIDDRPFG